jgi:hypothetical protein
VLQALHTEYSQLVQQWTKDYIWQKEPFELKICRSGGEAPSQIKGGKNARYWLSGLTPSCAHSHAVPFRSLDAAQEQLPHLWGRTRFGDSVDDEWFIVWLLLQLSRHDPHLAIRYLETQTSSPHWPGVLTSMPPRSVTDNDGQFLLIEAALVIPRWIKPETTKNRVRSIRIDHYGVLCTVSVRI